MTEYAFTYTASSGCMFWQVCSLFQTSVLIVKPKILLVLPLCVPKYGLLTPPSWIHGYCEAIYSQAK